MNIKLQITRSNEAGAGVVRVLLIITTTLLLIALVGSASIKRIGPDEIGLHVVNLGSEKGLEKKDYDAGFYRSIFLVESWVTLPRSVQKITFTARPDLRGPDDGPAIEAKTLDGDRVTVEASALVRIADGKGHSVYENLGSGNSFRARSRDVIGPSIAAAFATINTEEIYVAARRRATIEKLESETLRQKLASWNIELVKVSVLEVKYDPKYEAQLQRQKVATQRKLLEESTKTQAIETGRKNLIVQTTQNEVEKLKNDLKNKKDTLISENKKAISAEDAAGDIAKGKIEADALRYSLEKSAEGIKARKEAEAYSVRLYKDALGDNGNNVVAYQAALNFPVKNVTMPSSGIDWFSPLALAQKLGAMVAAGAGAR